MPIEVELNGTRITVYAPVIIAISENYAVTSVLRNGPSPDRKIVNAVIEVLTGNEIKDLTPEEHALALSILYGGVLLLDIGGEEPIPLSRILPQYEIRATGICDRTPKLSDKTVLSLWRNLYKGDLESALDLINKCAYKPNLKLSVNIENDPLPVGYISHPTTSF